MSLQGGWGKGGWILSMIPRFAAQILHYHAVCPAALVHSAMYRPLHKIPCDQEC